MKRAPVIAILIFSVFGGARLAHAQEAQQIPLTGGAVMTAPEDSVNAESEEAGMVVPTKGSPSAASQGGVSRNSSLAPESVPFEACAVVRVNAPVGKRPGEVEQIVKKGQMFRVEQKTTDNQHLLIATSSAKKSWISRKAVQLKVSSHCDAISRCATIRRATRGEDRDLNSALLVGTRYPVKESRNSQFGQASYLLKVDTKEVWVGQADVSVVTGTCWDSNARELGPVVVERRTFFSNVKLGVYAGYLMSQSAKSFDNLITKIPNSGDVSALQNPIISGVKTGSGYSLGLQLSKSFSDSFRATLGGSYKSIKYIYEGKANPSTSPVAYSALSSISGEMAVSYATGEIGLAYVVDLELFNLVLGLSEEFNYRLSAESSLTVREGGVFKAIEKEITTGPSATSFSTRPSVALQYGRWWARIQTSFELEVDLHLGAEF